MSLEDAYQLTGVSDIQSLFRVFNEEDQRLMHSWQWDYDNPDLLTNKIKEILSCLSPEQLSDEEFWRCQEMLWFWHHHAVSCAIRKRNKASAEFHVARALRYMGDDHPNMITQLLNLLIHDQLEEAEKWAQKVGESEQEAAEMLLTTYKAGGFF